ncbi:hypothetical protein [Fructobacillus ficulneus]|uniref:Acetyltransferase (GNAT) domain protein n=1 Tax=Fructobacillus ficulneus TaxID=157463 RepID=A0A0K8MGH1_9LACO|nr:hypothetical protein [Fructobacillus ficulneus]GAO99303.1 acetyltransferase (GNAT) domain protein [Fructobacillus ficulneus]
MEKLSFSVRPVSSLADKKQLDNYSCGVATLDEFVKSGYQKFEQMHVTSLNAVFIETALIGMYALSTSSSTTLFADKNRIRIFGEASCQRTLPMVSIDHLSVHQKFQRGMEFENIHLGTAILHYIFKTLIEMSNYYGIAFAGVMVESLGEPLEFYMKNGFYFIDLHEETIPNQETYTLAISYNDIRKSFEHAG